MKTRQEILRKLAELVLRKQFWNGAVLGDGEDRSFTVVIDADLDEVYEEVDRIMAVVKG